MAGKTELWVIRHGDRFEYSDFDQGWKDTLEEAGIHWGDPSLSGLGHQMARETAAALKNMGLKSGFELFVSPYLRCIQTAAPVSEAFGLPVTKMQIEEGLAEINHVPGKLHTPKQRAAYFPHVDVKYSSMLPVMPTAGEVGHDPLGSKERVPMENYPTGYIRRIHLFASELEKCIEGRQAVCVSHAASLGLVGALLRLKDLETLGSMAPCGIYKIERLPGKAWELKHQGHSHLSGVPPWPLTQPWNGHGGWQLKWKELAPSLQASDAGRSSRGSSLDPKFMNVSFKWVKHSNESHVGNMWWVDGSGRHKGPYPSPESGGEIVVLTSHAFLLVSCQQVYVLDESSYVKVCEGRGNQMQIGFEAVRADSAPGTELELCQAWTSGSFRWVKRADKNPLGTQWTVDSSGLRKEDGSIHKITVLTSHAFVRDEVNHLYLLDKRGQCVKVWDPSTKDDIGYQAERC